MKNLETNRLILKPLTIKFCTENYLYWLNNPVSNRYLSNKNEWNIEMLEAYLRNIEENKILSWAILLKENMKHIGNIKIDPINDEEKYGEYGILIGDSTEWGKGYAFEASHKIISYCFDEIQLKKINLGVRCDNENAIKLYKKLGFTITKEIKNIEGISDHYRMTVDYSQEIIENTNDTSTYNLLINDKN